MGSFVALYGLPDFVALLRKALDEDGLGAA